MFEFCQENLTLNETFTKRNFFFVQRDDINRNRPETEVHTLPGSRKVQQVLNTGKQYELKVRNLSCFCKSCDTANVKHCVNLEYVDQYDTKFLKPIKSKMSTDKFVQREKEEDHINQKTNDEKDVVMCSVPCSLDETDTEATRQSYFKSKLEKVQNLPTYEELENHAFDLQQEICEKYGELSVDTNITVLEYGFTGDAIAQQIMPDDLPENVISPIPVRIVGDGNCLPRCGSLLAFGNQVSTHTHTHTHIYLHKPGSEVQNKMFGIGIKQLKKCYLIQFVFSLQHVLHTSFTWASEFYTGTVLHGPLKYFHTQTSQIKSWCLKLTHTDIRLTHTNLRLTSTNRTSQPGVYSWASKKHKIHTGSQIGTLCKLIGFDC